MTRIDQFNNDEFRKGTYVVDPAGCGCTDCLMGYSTPEDELDADTTLTAMVLGFEIVDRRGEFKMKPEPTVGDLVRLGLFSERGA